AGRRRTADAVDQNVQTAETVQGCLDDVVRSRACAAIRLNKLFWIATCGNRSSRGEHRAATASQAIHDRFTDSFAAARDKDSLSAEFLRVVWDVRCAHSAPLHSK